MYYLASLSDKEISQVRGGNLCKLIVSTIGCAVSSSGAYITAYAGTFPEIEVMDTNGQVMKFTDGSSIKRKSIQYLRYTLYGISIGAFGIAMTLNAENICNL